MKRKLTILLVLLLSAAAVSCTKTQEIKILYWNIQNGMWADQGDDYDNFVEFVKSEDPDICVWAEAESRYRTGTMEKMAGSEETYLPWNWDLLARRYGHDYTLVCGKRDTFPQVITSKYPLRIVKRVTGDGDDIVVVHGAGWAQVDLGDAQLNVVTVHTWPQKYSYLAEDQKASAAEQGGDVFRSTDMKNICEQTILSQEGAEDELWMMLGDFNARSSIDNQHYQMDPSDKAFLLHDYIRAYTPYVDLIEKQYPGSFEHSTNNGKRIDFIYMTPKLYDKVTGSATIREGYPKSERLEGMSNFCTPSDHYPIVVTLNL